MTICYLWGFLVGCVCVVFGAAAEVSGGTVRMSGPMGMLSQMGEVKFQVDGDHEGVGTKGLETLGF